MSVAPPAPATAAATLGPAATARPATVSAARAAFWSLGSLALGHFAVDCCSGIWPVFKTLAHLDIAAAGLIATIGSMAGNGLQMAFGVLADRGFRKRLLVTGVAATAMVTFVPWAVRSYPLMAVLVIVTQLGSAAFHPSAAGAASMIAPRRAGLMIGIFLAGGYLGYSLSQALFSSLYGLGTGLTPLIALVPLAAAGAIALRLPASRSAATPRSFDWKAVGLHRRPLSSLFAVQVCASGINTVLVFLLPDLLLARRAAPWIAQGGGHFALVAGGCLSLLPAGYASDRWGARSAVTLANVASGIALALLLARTAASWADLALVMAFGAFNGVNNVVAVAEGGRLLPGHASGVSALLMGMPWCVAAVGPVIAGILADPARGGTPIAALTWFAALVPLALAASVWVPSERE